MRKNESVTQACNTLHEMWEAGGKPDPIVLRSPLLAAAEERSRLTKLILPRGIALRFYLLAVFEAQCRLGAGAPWKNVRPLKGVGSWSDLIAIDGAYDTATNTYMPAAFRSRKLEDLRLGQVKGALRTLEGLGEEDALVTVPRGARGQRLYESFSLMKESGRGGNQTPDLYTVPTRQWQAAKTITIPAAFFLQGWIQVLNPSEIATWLILRMLSKWAPRKHRTSGVFLTAQPRTQTFGLRDDAWEDGCQRLLDFGLIRRAEPPGIQGVDESATSLLFSQPARPRRRYEPHYWQVTDEGLDKDAAAKLDRELNLRQRVLDDTARNRVPGTTAPRRQSPGAQ
ncbi:hypothetical protein [Streptomyces sp. CB02261]|uniref:hypothetical protein n=1 Tax=Streptomyces sp. CB02261 TaxID=1703940 RepID=UPI00116140DA|nr:hypothetical protein [Streptomyces sp. CB02261]